MTRPSGRISPRVLRMPGRQSIRSTDAVPAAPSASAPALCGHPREHTTVSEPSSNLDATRVGRAASASSSSEPGDPSAPRSAVQRHRARVQRPRARSGPAPPPWTVQRALEHRGAACPPPPAACRPRRRCDGSAGPRARAPRGRASEEATPDDRRPLLRWRRISSRTDSPGTPTASDAAPSAGGPMPEGSTIDPGQDEPESPVPAPRGAVASSLSRVDPRAP